MTVRKKTILGAVALALAGIGFGTWQFFGPATKAPAGKYLFIKTGSSYETVRQQLSNQQIIRGSWAFNWLAQRLDYPQLVKAGRYEIKDGMSLWTLIRMLRSGRQSEVNFTIKKLRTPEDLASLVGRQLECDSLAMMQYIQQYRPTTADGLDSHTVMTAVIPNTYKLRWNSTPQQVFERLVTEQKKFWTPQRLKLADAHNLDPQRAYILASIVEEETNKAEDKGKIASVYLNRLETGMKLGADPTVKFAMKDFGLKRILNKHLSFESPYNTYLHTGLPPGPICTPSPQTIDAVLNAPHTSYLYFVAQPNLTGFSNFATTYQEHLQYARQYQLWIDSFLKAKAAQKQLQDY